LGKTNGGAIPGPLTIGLGLDGASGDIVRPLLSNQLSPGHTLSISSSGLLDVSGNFSYVTSVGSLTGSGNIQLGNNGLDCGFDNTSTTYGGVINGIAGGYILKYGTGAFTLTGSSVFPGIVQCEAGQIYLNGSMPSAIASFATGGLFGGVGTVGAFSFTHGTLGPGNNGPGILNCGSVGLNTNDTFLATIDGTTVGSGYSQLSVTGTVSLGNARLQLNMPVAGITNSQLTLIKAKRDAHRDGASTGRRGRLPHGNWEIYPGIAGFIRVNPALENMNEAPPRQNRTPSQGREGGAMVRFCFKAWPWPAWRWGRGCRFPDSFAQGGRAAIGNPPSLQSFRARQGRHGGQDGGTRAASRNSD